MRVALLTCSEMPNGIKDDRFLVDELLRRNHSVQFCVWDDEKIEWNNFDMAVIRSTWDYHHRFSDFLKRLKLIRSKCLLVNPIEAVEWNYAKTYLSQLASKNCQIVPTRFADNFEEALVAAKSLLSQNRKIVIKPEISAGSDRTFLISSEADFSGQIASILERGRLLAQPYIESVERDGEVSAVFYFDGDWKYSHSVLKRPKAGDYRVQQEFGGSTEEWIASKRVLESAIEALGFAPVGCLYARVDFLDFVSSPKIGEIELIEPELFFRHSSDFANHLVSAITEQYGP